MSTLSISGLSDVSAATRSYLPEPATTGYGVFKDAMDIASSIGKTALSATVGGLSGSADFQSLLDRQISAFQDMQVLTMVSNIERSKHDTKMAAIRNIRA